MRIVLDLRAVAQFAPLARRLSDQLRPGVPERAHALRLLNPYDLVALTAVDEHVTDVERGVPEAHPGAGAVEVDQVSDLLIAPVLQVALLNGWDRSTSTTLTGCAALNSA